MNESKIAQLESEDQQAVVTELRTLEQGVLSAGVHVSVRSQTCVEEGLLLCLPFLSR